MDSAQQMTLTNREMAIIRRWASGLEKVGSFDIVVIRRIDEQQLKVLYHGERPFGDIEDCLASMDCLKRNRS